MSEYRESKLIKRVSLFVFISIMILVTYQLQGCSVNDAISSNLKEEKFTEGCKVTHARTNIGYFSQTGDVGIPCKLKCSKELPPGYCLKYSAKTAYGNCDVQAGTCDNQESSK